MLKNKDNKLKILFIIIIAEFIIEYGSVTYIARNNLMMIIIYFAYIKILKNSKNHDKENKVKEESEYNENIKNSIL